MPHKLSLISEQTINDNGWNRYNGNPYNEEGIGKIVDNIGNAEIPVTSIPSPFAQMHLFETSFAFINKNFELDNSILDGKTTYHKYISYCLDIYEMLYNYETLKLKDRISIDIWDKNELVELSKSYNTGLQTFAKTLGIFINNYNNDVRFKNLGINSAFDKFILIYLDHNIIAGTSPYTGFFTVGNDLPKSVKSSSNNRRYFFSNNEPLYKRSVQFQKYMNILFSSNAELISAFKEVNSYIRNNNNKNTNQEFKLFIDKLYKNSDDNLSDENYKILEINNQELSFLNGKIPFYTERFNQEDEKKNVKKSDYIIQTSKSIPNTPLALLEGFENNRWEYLNGVFPKGCKLIPTDPISKRILPETVIEYPWITRNDLLSRHLVQLEYNINTSKYWMPNEEVKNILLPIKKEYFNFFTIEDLKKQLTIKKLNLGGIEVTLEIPIKADQGRGTIKFERTYSNVNPNTIDNDNYGAIINSSLALGIYPFFKVKETAYNDKYKILSYHEKGEEISYEFFKELLHEPKIETIPSTLFSRSRKEENFPAVTDYIDISSVSHSSLGNTVLDNDKDITFEGICLTIKNNDVNTESRCLLIPLMGEPKNLVDGNPSIAFDIGTSNSFVSIQTSNNIENISNYDSSGNTVVPHLVMLNEAQQYVDLYKSFDLESIKPFYGVAQNAEFMPTMVGEASLFKFPIRSIVNVDNDVNPETQNSINVLSNTNIPFAFGHNKLRQDLDYVHSNIKWGVTDSSNNAAKNILKGFIEQLVWMGRNKLLSEGYNPKAANVIWFKPLSMSAPQKSIFEEIWKDLHNTYFRKDIKPKASSKLISVTESRAPFYAYDTSFGSGKVFMNLDIGGGTTDLIVYNDRKPMLSTSFRFAGNSLFESKSITNPFDNGFVSKYENIMRKEFGDDFAKIDIITYIKNSKGLMSTDLLSYFFNYKSFNEKLKLDTHFKLLFLIHNCAIFYHSMQILKISKIEGIPYYVGTSGNGAKLLEITNGNSDLNRYNGLSTVLQYITKKLYGLDELPKMEIQILENPKESTAIGGIKGIEEIKQSPHADEESYYISVGNQTNLVKEQSKDYVYTKFLKEEDKTIEEVSKNVINFFTYFFDELWYETNVIKNFGVEASYNSEKLKIYFTDLDKISNTIRDVVNYKINVEKETSINDSLFFEAIKAYLYDFSKIIVSDKINEFKGAR